MYDWGKMLPPPADEGPRLDQLDGDQVGDNQGRDKTGRDGGSPRDSPVRDSFIIHSRENRFDSFC
jgi:hypothetical protein